MVWTPRALTVVSEVSQASANQVYIFLMRLNDSTAMKSDLKRS